MVRQKERRRSRESEGEEADIVLGGVEADLITALESICRRFVSDAVEEAAMTVVSHRTTRRVTRLCGS